MSNENTTNTPESQSSGDTASTADTSGQAFTETTDTTIETTTVSTGGPISYSPTPGLCYDTADEKYWDPHGLGTELTRTFEICHGCRMCFKFCDSFPSLFSFIDDRHNGDVTKLTEPEVDQVMDECFQCKLCEVQCPYTVRDSHEYQLDFPKLVHRYKAQRAKAGRLSLRDKLLGDPDRLGKAVRASGGAANWLKDQAPNRVLMEKTVGIHRDKLLPDYAKESFESWAKQTGLISDDPTQGEAVLFQTCFVQHNEPEIGRDTVDVLERNQVKITCEKGLECCGMPAWESGDLETTRKKIAHNIKKLLPHVQAGKKVLAINPTCAMMLRREWLELARPNERAAVEKIAAATMDPGEFLWSIRKEERFNTDFKSTPGSTVSYHAPCHLRAQAVGFKGRDLIKKIPGVKPKITMECCGHDGTYAMKVEGFEVSVRIGKKAFDGMKSNTAAEVWATECPLAAIQFQQHAGVKPMHPMSVLARAYEPDGFPTPVETD